MAHEKKRARKGGSQRVHQTLLRRPHPQTTLVAHEKPNREGRRWQWLTHLVWLAILLVPLAGCNDSGSRVPTTFAAAPSGSSGGSGQSGSGQSGSGSLPAHPDAPTATLTTPGGIVSGDVTIGYLLADAQSDTASIAVDLSRDGGQTWQSATRSAQSPATSGLQTSPTGVNHTFIWNSRADLGAVLETAIRIRIRPSDTQPGTPDETSNFTVDNRTSGQNSPPSASMIGLAGMWRGTIDLDYTVSDADTDTLSVIVEYSTDGGQSYHSATRGVGGDPTTGLASTATGRDYTFMWDSVADLGTSQAHNDVRVRITPVDSQPGVPANTGSFQVDNTSLGNQPSGPQLSYLSPKKGTVGATVRILGSGFGTSTLLNEVYFGTVKAPTHLMINGGGGIATSVPQGLTPGTYNVTVRANGNISNALPFTVEALPTLTDIQPNPAPIGAQVTLTGTHFDTSAPMVVRFTGASGVPVSATSSTQLTVTVPQGAQTGPVEVVRQNSPASNAIPFTVATTQQNQPPAAFISTPGSPSSGQIPVTYTLTDAEGDATDITVEVSTNGGGTWQAATRSGGDPTTGLTTSQAGVSHLFIWDSEADLGFVDESDVRLRITPDDGQTGQAATSTSFEVKNAASAPQAPTLTRLSPAQGAPFTTVQIEGTGFDSVAANNAIDFNGTPATPMSVFGNTLVTVVPKGATSGPVTVTTNGKTSNALAFTVLGSPTLSTIQPGIAAVGDTVTLTGTNFSTSFQGVVVRFGGGVSTTTTAQATDTIQVTVPSGAQTGPVTVVTNGATTNGVNLTITTTSSGGSGTVLASSPSGAVTITDISPDNGYRLQNTAITIKGSGFQAGKTSVEIGGNSLNNLTVVDSQTITGETKMVSLPGSVDVTVTVDGSVATVTDGFTYN